MSPKQDATWPALWMEERVKEPKETICRNLGGAVREVFSFRVSSGSGSAALLTAFVKLMKWLLSLRTVGEYTCVVFRKLIYF